MQTPFYWGTALSISNHNLYSADNKVNMLRQLCALARYDIEMTDYEYLNLATDIDNLVKDIRNMGE